MGIGEKVEVTSNFPLMMMGISYIGRKRGDEK